MDSEYEFAMQLETEYLDLESQVIIEINSECLQLLANAFVENYIVCISTRLLSSFTCIIVPVIKSGLSLCRCKSISK